VSGDQFLLRARPVGKEAEDEVEPCDLKDVPYVFVNAEQGELPLVRAQPLHRLNQTRQPGTVDVGHPGHIDKDRLGPRLQDRAESMQKSGGLAEVDFPYRDEEIRLWV